ncbi:aromatic amino acid lyase [Enterococcus raffinosus]|uniref:HAL/PAL/TAL family ammonia-lyase n=1 Tax=Enterococcus raffinosus TaxID=71452 RepID=UPI001C1095A7|nr:aromatic amino acid ammonia-lyase [Enterococcus raffinosus]MBU5361097.1 aromatic amino acid lyase [Enterococcus raffinosus]
MKTIVLDGSSLTLEDAWLIAEEEVKVTISEGALKRVEQSYDLLMAGAVSGTPVYGLTVGVGLNKDQKIFDASGELSPAVMEASKNFNRSMLRSHSAGIGAMMPNHLSRLSMAIRLNTLLQGQAAVQPAVVELYKEFLNQGISPLIPSRGSMGEADIMLASHVGLVMMGEWQANYQGETISGDQALEKTGLKKLTPIGKDGLAILSTNSISTAYALAGVRKVQQTLTVSPLVFGLSLEGLNGNIAPILPQPIGVRPFPLLQETAETMREVLVGSYLWESNKNRPLQDPLSYRTTVYTLSEAKRALIDLEEMITIQINSSDDNPSVIEGAGIEYREFDQVSQYFVETEEFSGGIFPSANFESLPVALAVQRLSLALGHISHNVIQRCLRLEETEFTGLPRFLTVLENKGHGFGSIHVPIVALHGEIMTLANPISLNVQPVAGGVEDTGTNALQAAQRLLEINESLNYLYGVELMHASQAIDMRMAESVLSLGKATKPFYEAYRKIVSFVKEDRIFTIDMEASKGFLECYQY